MKRSLLAAAAASLLASACARSEEATLVPPDDEAMTSVETVRSLERDDEAIALGDWRESIQGDRPALEFGPAGATPLFSLRCDERRGLVLQRHGAVPLGDLPMMLVTVGSETRRLAVTSSGGTIPMLRGTLASNDQFVPTLAEATVPITVRIGEQQPLILPPGPRIGAFISSCATGEATRRVSDAAAPPAGEDDAGAEAADPANSAEPAAAPAR